MVLGAAHPGQHGGAVARLGQRFDHFGQSKPALLRRVLFGPSSIYGLGQRFELAEILRVKTSIGEHGFDADDCLLNSLYPVGQNLVIALIFIGQLFIMIGRGGVGRF